MEIKKSAFVSSAAAPGDRIKSNYKQIAVVGKSNVGKSSFINLLTNDGKLARTGKLPGRTRLINYFLINETFFLTDLPGYGFAKVNREEKQKWARLVDDYLLNEESLCHVLFLVDIRHDPTADDAQMYNFLVRRNLPFTVVATKSDKLPKSQVKNRLRHLAAVFKLGEADILAVSGLLKTGREAVLDKIEQVISAQTP